MFHEIVDLRKGDRFNVVEPLTGTFGPADVGVLNISLTGLQISHPQPLRIGTRGRLWFRRGDVTVAIQAHVVWSHLQKGTGGAMAYISGLKIDNLDSQFAAAINSLLRGGTLRQDVDSMERKRRRIAERELEMKAKVRVLPPTSEPPPV